ncbi:hypothetical protein OHC33_011275, partial [Knufia fluminis]
MQLSETIILSANRIPTHKSYPGYTRRDAMKDRLIDLILLDKHLDCCETRRQWISEKIKAVVQQGKRWNQIIQHFGREAVLLLSTNVTEGR